MDIFFHIPWEQNDSILVWSNDSHVPQPHPKMVAKAYSTTNKKQLLSTMFLFFFLEVIENQMVPLIFSVPVFFTRIFIQAILLRSDTIIDSTFPVDSYGIKKLLGANAMVRASGCGLVF